MWMQRLAAILTGRHCWLALNAVIPTCFSTIFQERKNERSERFTMLELSTMSKCLMTAAVSVKVGVGNGIAFGLSCVDFGVGKGGGGVPLDPTSFQFFHWSNFHAWNVHHEQTANATESTSLFSFLCAHNRGTTALVVMERACMGMIR